MESTPNNDIARVEQPISRNMGEEGEIAQYKEYREQSNEQEQAAPNDRFGVLLCTTGSLRERNRTV